MNLSARIKDAKCKPNYVMNVNINIPIKSFNMQEDKSASGDFTFSPSRLNKKLKLEIPSARTYECESRKLSNLCETQHTISHRVKNRKKTVKSVEPGDIIALEPNFRKAKNHFRSEMVSPSGKQSRSKNIKMIESHKSIQNSQIMDRLFNEPEENIIGYTNQSSEFSKVDMIALKNSQKSIINSLHKLDRNEIKHLKLKIETPILEEERGLISEIRQYEKSAKCKKEHLNYAYLKEKVLKESSAKKIQRAWRNYKTQKLITSYSNNISLKFTNRMKNQLTSRQDPEESKILTVRSCGYNGKSNEFKRQGKRNLSLLQPIENNSDFDSGTEENIPVHQNATEPIIDHKSQIKNKKNQISEQSVIIKFQMEEIQRWEELIKNLRQGKKVDEVLKKSFERKEELERELSNSINNFHQINKEISSSEMEESLAIKQREISPIGVFEEISEEEQNKLKSGYKQEETKRIIVEELEKQISKFRIEKEEEATPLRKENFEFYENEIRRIDNEDMESKDMETLKQVADVRLDNRGERETEEEQNLKLKRKLEAINKVEFFNCIYEHKVHNQQTEEVSFLKVNDYQHTKQPNKEKEFHDVRENSDLSQFEVKENEFEDRLSISRKRTSQEHKSFYYEDDEIKLFVKYKAFLSVDKNRNNLVNKVEDEIMFDLLLELSEKDDFIERIEKVYENSPNKDNPHTDNKPEGICTNLESIKDYLENFVAFSFEEMPEKLLQGFNEPRQPEIKELLEYLNKGRDYESTDFHRSVLPEDLFNEHWSYAAEQIYFDVRYPDDPKKEAERVEYLKEITKIYFKVIFDGFNENLEQHRIYGREGKPFPWKNSLIKSREPLSIAEIKPMIRLGYRKLSQLAIIYCGLLFEDKKHTMSERMMEEIQKERLDTLIDIEMKEEEHKWSYSKIEEAETLWQLHYCLEDTLLKELCCDLELISLSR